METDIINTSGPPPAIGTKVPYFEVLGQDNSILSNDHFSGNKHLLILWDVKCPFSIDLLENISYLKSDLADSRIHVKLIQLHNNSRSEDTDAQNLLQEKGIDFPAFQDSDKSVKWAFNASQRPAMYLVDEDGAIVYRQIGYNEQVFNMLKTVVSQEN
jgi:peroxiredoxin